MNTLRCSRKGQMNTINGIGQVAIAILIAAVILGLGGTILSKIQAAQTDASTTILDNQSFNWPGNNTLTSFDIERVQTGSVVVYCNISKFTLGENYTVSSAGVNIINLTPSGIDLSGCLYNITYTYNYGSTARNSTEFGKIGMSTMSEFIPTIAIVAMAGIVIGIILVFFGRKKDEEVR